MPFQATPDKIIIFSIIIIVVQFVFIVLMIARNRRFRIRLHDLTYENLVKEKLATQKEIKLLKKAV